MADDDLDILAFRFFKLFAQYEWALKAMGYVKADNRAGAVNADWDRFANGPGRLIAETAESRAVAARDFLFARPPKLQVLVGGNLQWREVSGKDRTPQALFGHIRRIRNNLYHGGKFNGTWLDPERSHDLITHALCLLEALRALDHDLSLALSGNAG